MKNATTTLSQLRINPAINPRHQASKDDVSAIEAQILAHGFNDPLWVRVVENHYEIIDGSRRFRALTQLWDKGKWNGDQDIAIQIFDASDAEAREMALAGNLVRRDLSPADEAVAFTRLKLSGMAEQDIAVHFATTVKLVKQRIAIGSLPARIIDALRADEIDIRAAQAFTGTPSAERQLQIFDKLSKDGHVRANAVRNAIEDGTISAEDGRVGFVGLDAYIAAGGTVHADLFSDCDTLIDGDLLISLFKDKLDETQAALKAEGWSFVEIWHNPAWNAFDNWKTAKPKGTRELSEAEQENLEALRAELAKIEKPARIPRNQDELTDAEENELFEGEERADRIEDEIKAIEAPPYTDAQKRKSGVIIALKDDGEGGVEIKRGMVRPAAAKEAKRSLDPDLAEDDEGDPQPAPLAEMPSYSEKVTQLLLEKVEAATKLAMAVDKPALAARMGLAARIMAMAAHRAMAIEAPFTTRHGGQSGGAKFELVKQATLSIFGWLFDEEADLRGEADAPPHEVTFGDVLAKLETLEPQPIVQIEAVLAASEFRVEGIGLIATRAALDMIDADMAADGFAPDKTFLDLLSRKQVEAIITECGGDIPKKGKKDEAVSAALPLIESHGWLPKEMRTASYEGPGTNAFADKRAADLAASLAASPYGGGAPEQADATATDQPIAEASDLQAAE